MQTHNSTILLHCNSFPLRKKIRPARSVRVCMICTKSVLTRLDDFVAASTYSNTDASRMPRLKNRISVHLAA